MSGVLGLEIVHYLLNSGEMASKDPTRSLKLSQVDTYISSVPIQSIWRWITAVGGPGCKIDRSACANGGSVGMRVVSKDYFLFRLSRAVQRRSLYTSPPPHLSSWSAKCRPLGSKGSCMQYNSMGQQKDLIQFAGETWLEAIDWPASARQVSHAGPEWPEFHLDRKCGSARYSL